jgi:FtsH-binding integral membrane protein
VLQAVVLTGLVMVIMSVLGVLFPHFFTKWGLVLLPALTLLLVALLSQGVLYAVGVPYEHMRVLDYVITWAGIAIFTGLVAYDWAKALEMPRTVDNAIDASGGIILDAINLFLYILRALGGTQTSRS